MNTFQAIALTTVVAVWLVLAVAAIASALTSFVTLHWQFFWETPLGWRMLIVSVALYVWGVLNGRRVMAKRLSESD